jgi:hypothetical protein
MCNSSRCDQLVLDVLYLSGYLFSHDCICLVKICSNRSRGVDEIPFMRIAAGMVDIFLATGQEP